MKPLGETMEKARTGDLLKGMWELFVSNSTFAVILTLLLVGVGAGFDYVRPESYSNPAYTIVSFVVAIVLTKRSLDVLGLRNRSSAAGGAFFGLCIISNIAIVVGLILLIVPGLFLAARWSASGAILFAEEGTVSDSLKRSWDMTKGHVGAVVLAQLALIAIVAIPLAAAIVSLIFAGIEETSVTMLVVQNLGVSLWQIMSIFLGVAIFHRLRDGAEDLQAVFA